MNFDWQKPLYGAQCEPDFGWEAPAYEPPRLEPLLSLPMEPVLKPFDPMSEPMRGFLLAHRQAAISHPGY